MTADPIRDALSARADKHEALLGHSADPLGENRPGPRQPARRGTLLSRGRIAAAAVVLTVGAVSAGILFAGSTGDVPVGTVDESRTADAPSPPETFPTEPLGGDGSYRCVAGQRIRVYEFPTEAERESAVDALDPDDASQVGDASVAWAGNPIFWRFGERALAMYAGQDQAVIEHLDETLGPRVSEGRGRPTASDAFACGEDAAPAPSSDEWPSMVHQGACGALFVYAHNDSETHAVTMSFTDVTYEDVEAGLTLTVDLPHPSVEIELVEGAQVDDPLCNDMVGPDHRVDRTSVPSSGHLAVIVEGGKVEVQRLELHLDSGSEVVVQPFEVPIGTGGG